MSIIKLPILYEGSKGEKMLYTLFDSGASFSCIHADFAENLGLVDRLRKPKEVATANEGTYMKITHAMRLDFYLNDLLLCDDFMVVNNLSEEAIFGVTTLQKWRIKLDFEHDTVIVDPKIAKFILKNMK